MYRRIITAITVTCVMTTAASATWFARTDSGGKLIVTGVAENPDETVSAVYLTCKADILDLEVLTVMNASSDDLPTYKGTKMVLGYKARDGEPSKMGLDGEPVVSAGGVLSIRATLSADQSRALYESIGRGRRLDVEIIHPELSWDTGLKKVMADGSTTALLALTDACPELHR